MWSLSALDMSAFLKRENSKVIEHINHVCRIG